MTTIQRKAKAIADKYIVDDRDAYTLQKAIEAAMIELLNQVNDIVARSGASYACCASIVEDLEAEINSLRD